MRGWTLRLLLWLALTSRAHAQDTPPAIEVPQDGPRNRIVVRVSGQPGAYTGFDLLADGNLVAPVRFTSNGLITCAKPTITQSGDTTTLTLDDLTAAPDCGLKLGKSRVVVTLTAQKFPVVAFDLTIARFEPKRWKAVLGANPFHFLTLGMVDATVWQHRGWLNATPIADAFPLLQDVHVGTPELAAYPYNRQWSTTPPLSAHPLPVIGLWSPEHKLYAAWDFQATRLTDNSEPDIATGFCNHLVYPNQPAAPPLLTKETYKPDPRVASSQAEQKTMDAHFGQDKFVALVYPYGGAGYQQLMFPQGGEHLASRATLVFHTDLSDTDDPNRFLWQTWWSDNAIRNRLPRVPEVNDLSWMPGDSHLKTLPGAPGGNLIGGVEGKFQVPGTKLIYGWAWHNESAVAAPFKRGDKARITALEREAEQLVKYARTFKAGGEKCVYWEKPLVGQWTEEWGGRYVTTLHNANGWAAGRLLLDLYHAAGKKAYLPLVDGVFRWTKHIVWTRNEFADVPSSPFAIGGTLATSFLLDYYFTFKDDPDRREAARQALDLARSFTYRTMVMWASDSIRSDNLDSSFLWEPNSGRDWTGAACANEVFWNLDTLAQTAVHTGDPILLWALQGALSRWSVLYQNVYRSSLADYRASDFTEGYGLAPGNPYGYPGGRAPYGFSAPLTLMEPVGDTTARVLAGEKAALIFDRGGVHTRLHDYRCTGVGNFAFSLRSDRGETDVTVTFPYADLSGKSVTLLRNNTTRIPLEPGRQVIHDSNALWSVIIKGVRDRDMVVVGNPDLATAENLPVTPPLTSEKSPDTGAQIAPFQWLFLPANASLSTNWNHADTFASLPEGVRWVYGVPFSITKTHVLRGVGKLIRFPEPLVGLRTVYLLYVPTANSQNGENRLPIAILNGGEPAASGGVTQALGWHAWPPLFTQKLLVAAFTVPPGRKVVGVQTSGQTVVAVTALPNTSEASALSEAVRTYLAQGEVDYRMAMAREQVVAALREMAAKLPENALAIVPPDTENSPVSTLLAQSGFRTRAVTLTPEQLIDPAQFNAEKLPVAFALDGEDYLDTVKTPGDGANALVRYVQEGGTLVLMAGLPYPMYYAVGPNGKHEANPLLPRLGLPLVNALETLPDDTLTIRGRLPRKLLADAPYEFAFPDGDPRVRSVDKANLPPGATYTPIYYLRGKLDKDYGDVAGLIELPTGKNGKRGRILCLSNVVLRDPENGPRILRAALNMLFKTSP